MKKRIFVFFMLLAVLPLACTKEFLDKKPSKSLLVPGSLSDFQALLDFVDDMNEEPGLNVISSDDFYRADNTFVSLSPAGQNAYTWAKDIYGGTPVADWNKPYNQVFVTNVVLDGLKALKPGGYDAAEFKRIKGAALFYRSFAFYGLAQEFSANYTGASAGSLPGIPVRLGSDVNVIAGRGSLAQTYAQVVADLQSALALLPEKVAFKSRPCKAAAAALLARVYLAMGNYDGALAAADSCLALNPALIDYNTLSPLAARPFSSPLPYANEEVLFYAILSSTSAYNSSASTLVDTALYNSYESGDLRKTIFFNHKGPGNTVIKGNYTGASSMFGGLATDEVYLVRAECYARKGDIVNAMVDLNKLLLTRWASGTYIPYTAANADEALMLVLQERRKELVGRGLRWSDLRRLNTDSHYAVVLKRVVNGQGYELLPGGLNYVLPIPDNEVGSSGIAQNPRD